MHHDEKNDENMRRQEVPLINYPEMPKQRDEKIAALKGLRERAIALKDVELQNLIDDIIAYIHIFLTRTTLKTLNEHGVIIDNKAIFLEKSTLAIALVQSLVELREQIQTPSVEFEQALKSALTVVNSNALPIADDLKEQVKEIVSGTKQSLPEFYNSTKALAKSFTGNGEFFSPSNKKPITDLTAAIKNGAQFLRTPNIENARKIVVSGRNLARNNQDDPHCVQTAGCCMRYGASAGLMLAVPVVGVQLGFAIAGAGLALGTAVLGALTFGGALVLLGACLALFALGTYLRNRKGKTREFHSKLDAIDSQVTKMNTVVDEQRNRASAAVISEQKRPDEKKKESKSDLEVPLLKDDKKPHSSI